MIHYLLLGIKLKNTADNYEPYTASIYYKIIIFWLVLNKQTINSLTIANLFIAIFTWYWSLFFKFTRRLKMDNSTKNLSSPSSDESTEDFYHGYFDMRITLILFVTYSVIVTPVAIGLLYSIIWYEHNGCDSRRTLVNRLVSPICWTCIIFFIVPQLIDLCRYFYGPYSHKLCFFNLYIKNVLPIMNMFFFTFIAIAKYFSIFVLKNPLVYMDDFWCRFICLFVVISSILIQFIYDFLPGKYTINYFICTGINPALDKNVETAIIRNYSMFGACILLLIVSVFVHFRVSLFKQKMKSSDHLMPQVYEKKTLTGGLIQLANGLFLIFHFILLLKVQSLDMTKMDVYPNYLYLYYIHMWLAPNFSLMISFLYFGRNRPMREMVFREFRYLLTGHIDVNDASQECYNLNVWIENILILSLQSSFSIKDNSNLLPSGAQKEHMK